MKTSDKVLLLKFWRNPEFASLIPDKVSGGFAVKGTDNQLMTKAAAQEVIDKIQMFLDYYDDTAITEYNTILHEKLVEAFKEQIAESKNGFIYLIKAETGHYKIGRTKELKRRLNIFNVNLPFQIDLVHTFPAIKYTEAETWLHRHFKTKRINGEWFALEKEDVDLILRIKQYDPDKGGFLDYPPG